MRLPALSVALLLLAAACAAGSDDPGADGGSTGTGGVAGDGGAGHGGTGHAGAGGAGTGGVGPGGAGGSLPDPNTTPFPSTCSPRPPPRMLAWNRTTQTQVWSWDTWAAVLENRPLAPGESSALLPDANHLVVLDSATSTVEVLLVIDHEALRPVLGTGVTVAISYEDRDETWPTFVAFSYGDRLVWQYGLYAYADDWRGLTMTPDRALCLEDGPCPTYGRSVKVRWRDGPEEVVLPGDLVHLESSEDGLWFQLDGMFQPTGDGCALPWTTQGGWVAAMDPDFRSAPACTVGDDAPCGEGARCEPSEPQRCTTGVPGRCAPAPITCGSAEVRLCGCDGLVHDTACGVDVAQDGSGCAAPEGHFACGASFCRLGVERCEHVPAGLGEPERRWCRPVTGPCAAGPSGCACAAAEPCALGCTEQEPGAIALECVAPGATVNGRDPLCDAWVETLSASPEVDGVTTLAVFEHGLVRAASTERHVLASEPLRLYDVATGRDRPLNLLQGGAPLEVALSDERAVFHAIRRYGGTELSSVVVLDLASCEARELLLQPTTEPGGRRYGLSVDGDRAVFASSREPAADSTITLLDLRTGEEQQLTGQEGSAGGAQLVGDVVVFESAPDFDHRLELLRLSTGERRVIGPGYTAFHTDGLSVVWSDDNLAGGRSEIWLYDIEGGTARRLDASTEGELSRPLVAGDHVVWEEQVGIGSRIHHESIASGARTRLYESERSTFLHAIVGSTARLSASDGPVRDRLISVPLP